MFPVLFSIGPFELRTVSVFLVLAFMFSAFIFWKKGREEHYGEGEFFDGFILATLVGLLFGRIGFILLEFERFGFSPLSWIDIFAFPGTNGVIAVLAATIYIYRFAKKNKWDVFEVLDFWVIALATGIWWIHLGLFFDGTGIGTETSLPVGLLFPGLLEPHHPVQLYTVAFFILLAVYLGRVEYRYRTFEWYRGGRKTAQTGFLFSVFLLASAVFFFAVSWVREPVLNISGFAVDRVVALLMFVYGLVMLYIRSGRPLGKRRTHTTVADDAAPSSV